MNNNLEHLIPQSILDCLKLDLIDLEIELQAQPAQGRWPCVNLRVNDTSFYSGPVVGLQKFKYSAKSQPDQKKCTIEIVFYNKGNNDTVVNDHGEIVENQNVAIVSVVANGVDLVKTNLIHKGIGCYTMNLSDEKYKYFVDNNINVAPNTSLFMFENGTWQIELGIPVLSFITGLHDIVEPWEKVHVHELLNNLYQQYLICKNLENNNDFTR